MKDSSFFVIAGSVLAPKWSKLMRARYSHDASMTCLDETTPIILVKDIIEKRDDEGDMYLANAYITYQYLPPLIKNQEEITRRLLG